MRGVRGEPEAEGGPACLSAQGGEGDRCGAGRAGGVQQLGSPFCFPCRQRMQWAVPTGPARLMLVHACVRCRHATTRHWLHACSPGCLAACLAACLQAMSAEEFANADLDKLVKQHQ